MTKTYNDVEAVTRLLDEKEKDLELAARIGQGLLARNKALEDRLLAVESELTSTHDTVTQLRHDLLLKSELLQIYSNDFDDNSPDGVRGLTFDLLQRKVKGLEDDNRKLRAEASKLACDSTETEEKEEQLLRELVSQLADANSQVKNLDDELATKYEESSKQREEITSLIGQLVEQRQKIRDLTLENEELVMQLRVVRECQSELAAELADYKEKYAEILVLLHETQEQLKEQNKRNAPTAYTGCPTAIPPRLTSSFPPDSLASELELSSLSSVDGWASDASTSHNLPKCTFQRVFDTVRCVSQTSSAPGQYLAASTPANAMPRVVVNASTPIAEISPSFQKAQSVLKDLVAASEMDYPTTLKLGVPGRPGTVDLANAIRRLTPKPNGQTGTAGQSTPASQGWRTPDSVMSTGSRSAVSSLNGVQHQHAEKLKIIKPLEGSTTLHNWSRLAKPHLGALLEVRPGVATRELDPRHQYPVKYSQELLEMYNLYDVEEDGEDESIERSVNGSSPTFASKSSEALHPDGIRTNLPFRRALFSSTEDYPSLDPSINDELGSCAITNDAAVHSGRCADTQRPTPREADRWATSGLSTPNNSPGTATPDRQPFYYNPLGLLQQGAEMIRRTFAGEDTPEAMPEPLVPRISRKQLLDLTNMNLMDKLEKLGLDEVKQRSASVSPMALLAALETLCYSNDEDAEALSIRSATPTSDVNRSAALDSTIKRNKSTPTLEALASPKLASPVHRASSCAQTSSGLNAISDLGSPDNAAQSSSSSNIRAKFQAY